MLTPWLLRCRNFSGPQRHLEETSRSCRMNHNHSNHSPNAAGITADEQTDIKYVTTVSRIVSKHDPSLGYPVRSGHVGLFEERPAKTSLFLVVRKRGRCHPKKHFDYFVRIACTRVSGTWKRDTRAAAPEAGAARRVCSSKKTRRR